MPELIRDDAPAPGSTAGLSGASHAIEPPSNWLGILKQLGPGLVIAGSIVGSGELIATTKTGAQAGIDLLWLIVVGCVIKVFVQIELGRYAITHGETTLTALNRVPGRIGPANWIVWFWLAMIFCSFAQLGGIVAGVGQSLAIAFPITGDYRTTIEVPSNREIAWYLQWEEDLAGGGAKLGALSESERARVLTGHARLKQQLDQLGERGQEVIARVRNGTGGADAITWDDRYWSLGVTLVTIALLVNGRYGILQNISIAMVVAFTFITVGNVCALQTTEQWRLSWEDIQRGFGFHLPAGSRGKQALITALSTFGIIGVGATELITYPYWCLEKGYARFTGPRSDDDAWADRARGWLRVMNYDAFLSMFVYTFATVAFYVLGAAVLHREGRDPEGMRMVSTLAAAYAPVFGTYAKWLFLSGAIAVLYSTFLVANAGNARMFADALGVFGFIDPKSERSRRISISVLCVFIPLFCVSMHWSGVDPVKAVLVAGMMQAAMLPMIGFGAIYFRRTATDPRLAPRKAWDAMVIISFLGLLTAGAWGVIARVMDLIRAWAIIG